MLWGAESRGKQQWAGLPDITVFSFQSLSTLRPGKRGNGDHERSSLAETFAAVPEPWISSECTARRLWAVVLRDVSCMGFNVPAQLILLLFATGYPS